MKTFILACLVVLSTTSSGLAQASVFLTRTSYGQIVALDAQRGEVTVSRGGRSITYAIDPAKKKLSPDQIRTENGELFARLAVGQWISFQSIARYDRGESTPSELWITGIRWLGTSENAKLPLILRLPESAVIAPLTSQALPQKNPIQLFLEFTADVQRTEFLKWVDKWNRKQAAKQVAIKVVDSLAEADVAFVTYRFDPAKARAGEPGDSTDYISAHYDESQRVNYAVVLVIRDADHYGILSFRLVETERGRFVEDITKGLEHRLLEVRLGGGH